MAWLDGWMNHKWRIFGPLWDWPKYFFRACHRQIMANSVKSCKSSPFDELRRKKQWKRGQKSVIYAREIPFWLNFVLVIFKLRDRPSLPAQADSGVGTKLFVVGTKWALQRRAGRLPQPSGRHFFRFGPKIRHSLRIQPYSNNFWKFHQNGWYRYLRHFQNVALLS